MVFKVPEILSISWCKGQFLYVLMGVILYLVVEKSHWNLAAPISCICTTGGRGGQKANADRGCPLLAAVGLQCEPAPWIAPR